MNPPACTMSIFEGSSNYCPFLIGIEKFLFALCCRRCHQSQPAPSTGHPRLLYPTENRQGRCTLQCTGRDGVLYREQVGTVYPTVYWQGWCTLQCKGRDGEPYSVQVGMVYPTVYRQGLCNLQCKGRDGGPYSEQVGMVYPTVYRKGLRQFKISVERREGGGQPPFA